MWASNLARGARNSVGPIVKAKTTRKELGDDDLNICFRSKTDAFVPHVKPMRQISLQPESIAGLWLLDFWVGYRKNPQVGIGQTVSPLLS